MPAARATVPRGAITALTRPGGRLTRQMATGRLLASMAHFLDEQARLNRKWIEARLMTRSTAGLQRGALRTVGLDVQRESTLERAFRKASMDRISAKLPAVLAKPIYSRQDRQERWDAINALLEPELRFARQRQEALSSRILRAVERAKVAQGSPEGAFWRLGPTRTHTPDCVAMADRFHPWPVLARVHPPLHPGCACTLHAKGVAVANGWMGPDDAPGLDAAIRHAAQAVPEGVAEGWLEELAIREALAELGFDTSMIPLGEAFNVNQARWPKGHPRAGQWRPKLATQAVGMGDELEKLLAPARVELADMQASGETADPDRLAGLGGMLDEAAARFSTRSAYEQRLARVDADTRTLEAEYQRLGEEVRGFLVKPGETLSPERAAERDRVMAREQATSDRLMGLWEEHHRVRRDMQRADRDAIVGVLSRFREMGGSIQLQRTDVVDDGPKKDRSIFSPQTQARFHEADLARVRSVPSERLAEVQRLLPADWVRRMNGAGGVYFEVHTGRFRADHQWLPQKQPPLRPGEGVTVAQQEELGRIIGRGGSYEGMYGGIFPVVRRPGTQEGGVGPNAAIYDWIDASGQMRNLHDETVAPPGGYVSSRWDRNAPRPQVRAPTTGGDSRIRIKASESAQVVLHELGHRVQSVEGRGDASVVREAQRRFLQLRCGRGQLQKLQEIVPGASYDEWERAIPDEFVDPYYGKVYGELGGVTNELLTMALQDLFYNGARLREGDPGTMRWMLGLLVAG